MADPAEPFFVHASLAPLLRLPDFLHRRITFISERTPNRERWYRWLPHRLLRQFAFQQGHHLELAGTVWRAREAEIFFLFEHKAMYAWPLYLALLLKRRPCFFIVHGLQQLAVRSPLHRLGLALCRAWVRAGEFYPIHLELGDAALPPGRRFDPAKSLVIPHPHPRAEIALPPPQRTGPLRVGVVGMLRRDKPVARLLELLLEGARVGEYELIVGTPFWQKESWLDALPVTLRDTHDDAAYDACLAEIDLLVADFRREDYEFRPSGVVIDAAMAGCFVLAPDYPVIRVEIERPVPIGAVYASVEEVPSLVRRHLAAARSSPPDFARWRAHRRMEVIAPILAEFLRSREIGRATAPA
jgi:hypothetical protein